MEAMIGSVRILGGCALLSFVALASTQEPAAGAAKPDRSAEARLREVFREMGKLRSAAFRVDRISREESSLPWMLEGSLQGVVEGESFWVEATDTWGGGRRLVSDGTTLLVDFLDKGVGVALRDAKPAIYANDESLAMRGEASSPLFYFLAGEKGFEERSGLGPRSWGRLRCSSRRSRSCLCGGWSSTIWNGGANRRGCGRSGEQWSRGTLWKFTR
jgi:hypothetical protein